MVWVIWMIWMIDVVENMILLLWQHLQSFRLEDIRRDSKTLTLVLDELAKIDETKNDFIDRIAGKIKDRLIAVSVL
jgi:predicted ATPase